jgi:hypothetical protein
VLRIRVITKLQNTNIGNRIPKEQGKRIIQKTTESNEKTKSRYNVHVTHTKTTKRTGTQKQQSTEKKCT